MYSTGDECLPAKVTLGDYLKVTREEDFDPAKTAFLMPTAEGPCRFGQYRSAMKDVFNKLGLEDVLILSPSSGNGYGGIGGKSITFFLNAWISLVCSDILRKMLLKIRPYEKEKGTTDRVYEQGLLRLERIFEKQGISYRKRFKSIIDELTRIRDDFRAIDADYVQGRPLIAVVGEIFCRHNRFANENMLRKLEEYGAETWIADVSEWIFYTIWSRMDYLTLIGKRFSKEMATSKLKKYVLRKEEHKLLAVFKDDFKGYEEPPNTEQMIVYGEKYLSAQRALGEMALSISRSGYCYHKGADGVVDISPFSCMNGIVSEAVYPSFSKDHDDIPCRVFYFDGINLDLDRDVGIFMELVRGYMSRKKMKRVYPAYFRSSQNDTKK